jgi:hypothetical protein
MKQKPIRRAYQKKAKTVLRLPDLEFAKTTVLANRPAPMPSVAIAMPLTNPLTGIARSSGAFLDRLRVGYV